MARKSNAKHRHFFEPWVAEKSTINGKEPDCEGFPEEAAAQVKEAWARADQHADWIIWGTQMYPPEMLTSLMSNQRVYHDGRGIIAVRRRLGLPEGSPTHEDICKRIAECVNAMAGVADPVAFMADVREMLRSYVAGESFDAREDSRFVSLLSRSIPPKEVQHGGYGEQPAD